MINKFHKSNVKLKMLSLVILIMGSALSVALHEMFHVILHWGKVTDVDFFTDGAIVRLTTTMAKGYDTLPEEIVAYSITFMVVFMTTILVCYLKRNKEL